MARQSFFAEKRSNNPNFFTFMGIDDLRRNVKRIIKDAKMDIISEQDYIYFSNEKVISACISESKEMYTKAGVTCMALNYYINQILRYNATPYPGMNISEEITIATKEASIQTARYNNWLVAYNVFLAISSGVPINIAMAPIRNNAGFDANCL